jgi:hypothetical protein
MTTAVAEVQPVKRGRGRPKLPDTKRQTVSARLAPELRAALIAEAIATKCSLSDVVERRLFGSLSLDVAA